MLEALGHGLNARLEDAAGGGLEGQRQSCGLDPVENWALRHDCLLVEHLQPGRTLLIARVVVVKLVVLLNGPGHVRLRLRLRLWGTVFVTWNRLSLKGVGAPCLAHPIGLLLIRHLLAVLLLLIQVLQRVDGGEVQPPAKQPPVLLESKVQARRACTGDGRSPWRSVY